MLYVWKRRANIFSVGRKVVKLLCLVMLVFGKYTGWFNSMRQWWGQACPPLDCRQVCQLLDHRKGLPDNHRPTGSLPAPTGRSRLPRQPNRLLSCRYGTCRPSRGRHGSYRHGLLYEARTWLLGPDLAPWPQSTAPWCSRAKSTDHRCGKGERNQGQRERRLESIVFVCLVSVNLLALVLVYNKVAFQLGVDFPHV